MLRHIGRYILTVTLASGLMITAALAAAPCSADGDAATYSHLAAELGLGQVQEIKSGVVHGFTTEGMAVILDPRIGAPCEYVFGPQASFNRRTTAVATPEQAEQRAREFLRMWAPKLGLADFSDETKADLVPSSPNDNYSGWDVTLRLYEGDVGLLPWFLVGVDASGHIAKVFCVRAKDETDAQPKLQLADAKAALLARHGAKALADPGEVKLMVWPDQQGHARLEWLIYHAKAVGMRELISGAVDAHTGEVIWVSRTAGEVGPEPSASHSRPVAYALAALAGLLVVFLVVKLRKR